MSGAIRIYKDEIKNWLRAAAYLHCLLSFLVVLYFVLLDSIDTFRPKDLEKEIERTIEAHSSKCRHEKSCMVNISRSSIENYNSLSLENTQVIFVHFYPSDKRSNSDKRIVDLVWIESSTSAFLHFSLDFNMYSLRTLSRKVQHVNAMVENVPTNCSKECLVESSATAYLNNVTKRKGALCYIREFYRKYLYFECCEENIRTHQIECGGISGRAKTHFLKFVAAIVIICTIFTYRFGITNTSPETLSNNPAVFGNPFQYFFKLIVKAIRSHSSENNLLLILGNLFKYLLFPTLVYVDWIFIWYSRTYDVPKMFSNIEHSLIASYLPYLNYINHRAFMLLFYVFLVLLYIPTEMEIFKNSPITLEIKSVINRQKAGYKETFYLLRLVSQTLSFLKKLSIYFFWMYDWLPPYKVIRLAIGIPLFLVFEVLLFVSSASVFFVILESMTFVANVLIYLTLGLVASKDYYLPYMTLIFIIIYYVWNCFYHVGTTYQSLVKQTFEKCKEYEEEHPYVVKALTFDEKGFPIYSKLFAEVIDEIAPRRVMYAGAIGKASLSVLFLLLIYFSIDILGGPTLNSTTQSVAIFVTGLIPKLIEMCGESSKELREIENACRIEKIVTDYYSDLGSSECCLYYIEETDSDGSMDEVNCDEQNEIIVTVDVHNTARRENSNNYEFITNV